MKLKFNIFKKMIQSFKEQKALQKEQKAFKKFQHINKRFFLSEKNNKMYIMCGDFAIYEAKDTEQSSEVLHKLEEIRSIAQKHNTYDDSRL